MYSSRPAFILGFHGCDRIVADRVIQGEEDLIRSENLYDWLGHGIYFWEHNPLRAMEWAIELRDNPSYGGKVTEPAVVGAIIDVGNCLDLLESKSIKILKTGYDMLVEIQKAKGWPLPKNKGGDDLLLRHLDCAVIQTIHEYNKEHDEKPFDTVRGVFVEGSKVYENAGFNEKNHIQIAVRNLNCIKGYFLPREESSEPFS